MSNKPRSVPPPPLTAFRAATGPRPPALARQHPRPVVAQTSPARWPLPAPARPAPPPLRQQSIAGAAPRRPAVAAVPGVRAAPPLWRPEVAPPAIVQWQPAIRAVAPPPVPGRRAAGAGFAPPARVVQRAAAELSDAARYRINKEKIDAALASLYAQFYGNDGVRKDLAGADVKSVVYAALGKETSAYLATPLTGLGRLAIADDADPDYLVHKQAATKAVTADDLSRRYYYHVHNKHYVKPASRTGLARRIVINVASQQDAVKVSDKFIDLFKSSNSGDAAIGQHIKEFKVYLGNIATDRVKKDKLVVYYDYAPGSGGADAVGDGIVAVVQSAGVVFGEDLAPFYSVVAPGIAWAEEPKYHSDRSTMQGSFTTTRASVIAYVIKHNDRVAGLAGFVDLVAERFRRDGVDLARAHRHS